jgi:hypothetical protein
MASTRKPMRLRHLAGLLMAAVLGLACYALYLYVPIWIRGTFLQGLGNLVTFLAVIVLLSLAERLWGALQRLFHGDPP